MIEVPLTPDPNNMHCILLGSGESGTSIILVKEKLTLEALGFFEKPKFFDFL
jgi:hypothetical protein